jgi:hypothetical protein
MLSVDAVHVTSICVDATAVATTPDGIDGGIESFERIVCDTVNVFASAT